MAGSALQLAQDPAADRFLTDDPLALLVGMLLDQQFPMERAFAAPYELARRLGVDRLSAADLAGADRDQLAALFVGPPALHRFPGAMAGRVQALCQHLLDGYGGEATAVWSDVDSADEMLRRLERLPGFGRQKAQIFLALLGKQLGVAAPGWRAAAGPYGEPGSHRSVADVTDAASLAAVREYKRAAKARARAAGRPATARG